MFLVDINNLQLQAGIIYFLRNIITRSLNLVYFIIPKSYRVIFCLFDWSVVYTMVIFFFFNFLLYMSFPEEYELLECILKKLLIVNQRLEASKTVASAAV